MGLEMFTVNKIFLTLSANYSSEASKLLLVINGSTAAGPRGISLPCSPTIPDICMCV